ncbi:heat shock protein 12A [Caerostris extrusa]|uniref:Heat shock protein 12A n=1 Tax=Caerostris extrusa TaxID=172846 RepID=A0AAV4VY47_CAEEX|nr:heat shock protein 12A [Caerostris extrusa]
MFRLKNQVQRISLRNHPANKSPSNSELQSESQNYISSLEVKTNSSPNNCGKGACITNIGNNSYRILKTESLDDCTQPFVVEKTVIIVSENNPGFSYELNDRICENRLNSNYISNIDTSVSSMNNEFTYLDTEKKIIANTISTKNPKEVDQVKVINSLPLKSDHAFKIELDHFSHQPHNSNEVYEQEKNIIDRKRSQKGRTCMLF